MLAGLSAFSAATSRPGAAIRCRRPLLGRCSRPPRVAVRRTRMCGRPSGCAFVTCTADSCAAGCRRRHLWGP
eukprot:3740580-Alexandrium_andersonii.AAC.1